MAKRDDANLEGPAYAPGHVLVGIALQVILGDESESADPFARAKPMIEKLEAWAREADGVSPSFPFIKELAQQLDAGEWDAAHDDVAALAEDLDPESQEELWSRVESYAGLLVVQAMLCGLWAGANITAEAVGSRLNPLQRDTNATWTMARKLVRIAMDRSRARH